MEALASSSDRPRAVRTCEGPGVVEVHAAPDETATSLLAQSVQPACCSRESWWQLVQRLVGKGQDAADRPPRVRGFEQLGIRNGTERR